MKNYIFALLGGLICIFIGYKSATPPDKIISLNKELLKIGNELEQLTINGYFCDTNRLTNLKQTEQIQECFDYRRNLLRSNESLKFVLDNISAVHCPQSFIKNLFVSVNDLYSVTSSLIIYESQDVSISFANPKLSKEMLNAAKFIRHVDADNCLIKEKE